MHFRSFVLAILALASLCSAGACQITSGGATTRYMLSGVEGKQQVGEVLLVSPDSKPVVVPVGLVSIKARGVVRVKASNVKREPFQVQPVAKMPTEQEGVTEWQFLVLGRGRIWVDVLEINFQDNDFNQREFVVEVGAPDDPEPDVPEPDKPDPDTPAPEVPDDDFDNLGQRVAKLAAGLPSNAALSEIYADAAKQLRGDPSVTINQVSEAMLKKFEDVTEYRQYAKVRELINTETTQRWPMSKGVLADFWAAVSAGYGGAK